MRAADMKFRQHLEVKLRGHGRGLFVSFLMALVLMASVAAVLKTIAIVIEKVTIVEVVEPPVIEVTHLTEPAEPETVEESTPLNEVANAQPPVSPTEVVPPLIQSDQPSEVEYQVTEVEKFSSSDLLAELTDLKPVFEEPKPTPKPKAKPATPKVAKKSTSVPKKPSGPSEAEKRRQEQKRRAALASKIKRKLTLVSRAGVTYPRSAKRRGVEGTAIVTITVGPNGRVSSSRISKSSGSSALDKAALSSARKYRFKPALNGLGEPVTSQTRIPITFKLRG